MSTVPAVKANREPASLLSIIDRVVGTGEMTADKVGVLERLLAMQMTVREEERKAAFANALVDLQAAIPQIVIWKVTTRRPLLSVTSSSGSRSMRVRAGPDHRSSRRGRQVLCDGVRGQGNSGHAPLA